jgi:hypothetical protein
LNIENDFNSSFLYLKEKIKTISELYLLNKDEKQEINNNLKEEMNISLFELFKIVKTENIIDSNDLKEFKDPFNYQNNNHWEIFCKLLSIKLY